ncbi:MAG: DUF2608 domain-containing protein [Gammaproteobacteria bacterium]|nr:DUF2608 domain-containing protein [Gammaproteobacteria bacterium]
MFRSESSIVRVENVSKMAEVISTKISKDRLDPSKTLILVDLDLTLFDRPGIMSDLYPGERKEFMDSLAKTDPSLIEIAYAQSPYKLIEEEMAGYIKKLVEQGFIVLGFTSRRTGKAKADAFSSVEEDACKSVQKIGVNFSKVATQEFDIPENSVQLENPNLRPYEIIGKPKIFGDSFGATTIFTANYPKGLILESVVKHLSSLGIEITDIIETDDNVKYLQNLKNVCVTNKLNFTGLHYTFAHDHKHELNPDVVAIQKERLIDKRELISDSSALQVLENSKSRLSMSKSFA